ncbi:MAG: hypothetical protein EZS26_000029 [Candidatus Ordinivivax streblomastigis]|uniref:Lipoprotein n=1 Tax=Candidatus Ordinivivax streblomastigis TaxID=2540710 RepID=A0A5M8P519_9BACT|nr:MAG: hypothetical protein EZS26_000029 [Candidatus Ordinivivax streblomastigis]
MNKQLISSIVFIAFIFAACRPSGSDTAQSQLQQARQLYEQAHYGSAKTLLAELKKQHPKDYDIQKEALRLTREIDYQEQLRNRSFCDSVLLIGQMKAAELKRSFVLEKTEYDHAGRYVDKLWNPSPELNGNYLKTSVDEWGEIVLTSAYRSDSPIGCNQLKVSIPSGEYADTQVIPFDGGANYRFKDGLGMTSETLTFQKGRDNGVIAFIANHAAANIRLDYLGGKKTSFRMLFEIEKTALNRTVELSAVLSSLEHIQKEKEKAEKRLNYLQEKLQK